MSEEPSLIFDLEIAQVKCKMSHSDCQFFVNFIPRNSVSQYNDFKIIFDKLTTKSNDSVPYHNLQANSLNLNIYQGHPNKMFRFQSPSLS